MPVYARQLGFSTFVVGTIYSILPILGLVAKPLFGALADKFVLRISLFQSRNAAIFFNQFFSHRAYEQVPATQVNVPGFYTVDSHIVCIDKIHYAHSENEST